MTVRLEIPIGPEDHALGNPEAPVTLLEYADFQCPFCAKAHPLLKQVRHRFGADLRFVFRHAPQTRLHAQAQVAAEASEAAGAQGSFWPMHDRLFERTTSLAWPNLLDDARHLGLDLTRFEADVMLHRFREVVTRLERSGARTVRGTPTFFLDDIRYEESSDVETLGAAIQRALDPHRGESCERIARLELISDR